MLWHMVDEWSMFKVSIRNCLTREVVFMYVQCFLLQPFGDGVFCHSCLVTRFGGHEILTSEIVFKCSQVSFKVSFVYEVSWSGKLGHKISGLWRTILKFCWSEELINPIEIHLVLQLCSTFSMQFHLVLQPSGISSMKNFLTSLPFLTYLRDCKHGRTRKQHRSWTFSLGDQVFDGYRVTSDGE